MWIGLLVRMGDVIQQAAILYVENNFLEGPIPFPDQLLILLGVPVKAFHERSIEDVCLLSSIEPDNRNSVIGLSAIALPAKHLTILQLSLATF